MNDGRVEVFVDEWLVTISEETDAGLDHQVDNHEVVSHSKGNHQLLEIAVGFLQAENIDICQRPGYFAYSHLRKIDRNKKTYLQKGHGLHESGG